MKTLKFIDGNLLTNPNVEVIGHQANCQNTFGGGIARAIREMYPEAYAADTAAKMRQENTLGRFSRSEIPLVNGIKNRHGNYISRIYNLYGQNLGTDHTKLGHRKTDYEALYCALEGMANELRETEEDKMMFDYCREPVVGFPFLMGSALGGGNWHVVQRLIEVAFDGYKSDVLIVRLNT
jgi:O-acetyl-ADP-ribose deacetylase (regulator of RNase III)